MGDSTSAYPIPSVASRSWGWGQRMKADRRLGTRSSLFIRCLLLCQSIDPYIVKDDLDAGFIKGSDSQANTPLLEGSILHVG